MGPVLRLRTGPFAYLCLGQGVLLGPECQLCPWTPLQRSGQASSFDDGATPVFAGRYGPIMVAPCEIPSPQASVWRTALAYFSPQWGEKLRRYSCSSSRLDIPGRHSQIRKPFCRVHASRRATKSSDLQRVLSTTTLNSRLDSRSYATCKTGSRVFLCVGFPDGSCFHRPQ